MRGLSAHFDHTEADQAVVLMVAQILAIADGNLPDDGYGGQAREVVAAISPHIAARALRDAAVVADDLFANSLVTGFLRERADRLEAGDYEEVSRVQ